MRLEGSGLPNPFGDPEEHLRMAAAERQRRTRILALDVAAKVAAGLAVNHATTSTANVSQFTVDMARAFEKYIDGEDQ